MKRMIDAVLTLLVLAAFAQGLRAQCPVKVNAGCETLCAPGTFEVGESYCVGTLIQATGANSYSWYASGWGIVSTTSSYSFVPSAAGNTVFTVTGECLDEQGQTITGFSSITITVKKCSGEQTVGIEELTPGTGPPATYWDLMGNRIEKPLKGLYVERRGATSRKVMSIDTNQ